MHCHLARLQPQDPQEKMRRVEELRLRRCFCGAPTFLAPCTRGALSLVCIIFDTQHNAMAFSRHDAAHGRAVHRASCSCGRSWPHRLHGLKKTPSQWFVCRGLPPRPSVCWPLVRRGAAEARPGGAAATAGAAVLPARTPQPTAVGAAPARASAGATQVTAPAVARCGQALGHWAAPTKVVPARPMGPRGRAKCATQHESQARNAAPSQQHATACKACSCAHVPVAPRLLYRRARGVTDTHTGTMRV